MPLFSKTVTGLINGVSRQPWALHLDSQAYDQINCLSNLSRGPTRRPGIELVARLDYTDDLPSGLGGAADAFHWIDRDETHRYLVLVDSSTSGAAAVRVVDMLTGTAYTPTGSPHAYLQLSSGNNARESLKFLTVGDTTYIVNTTKTPAMEAATGGAPADYAIVWVKAAPYVDFTLTVKKTSSGATATGTEPNGSVKADSTETLATNLAAEINGDTCGSTTVMATALGNLIFIRLADNSAFTVEARDGWGNQGMAAFVNGGKVQNFAELPARAPDGFMLEVEGDPDASNDSYFVKFFVSNATEVQDIDTSGGTDNKTAGYGTWQETAKWGEQYEIDVDTMPIKLTGSGASWTLSTIDWTDRVVGDAESAPDPPFIGSPIQDVAFFQNRLGFIVGETVAFSGVDDFHNFFPTTVISSADDDAFSMTANFPEVAKLRYGVPFNDLLVLFSDSGIYGCRGTDSGFSARTAEFLRLTAFTGSVSTRPVLAGDRIFFTVNRDNETQLYEFVIVDVDGAYAAEAVSEHVDNYIVPDVAMIAADGARSMVSLLSPTQGAPAVWSYQYFVANREKVQSAWHRWSLTGMKDADRLDYGEIPFVQPLSCSYIGGFFYIALTFPYASGLWICRINLTPGYTNELGAGSGAPLPTDTNHLVPYFDYWALASGVTVTGGDTEVIADAPLHYLTSSPTTDIFVMPWDPSSGHSNMGTSYTVKSAVANGEGGCKITVDEELSSTTVLVGVRYRSTWEARPNAVIRAQQTSPALGGRYHLKRMRALFAEPVTVYAHFVDLPKSTSNPLTTNRRLQYTQKREIEFPVNRPLDNDLVVGIHSEMPLQDFNLYGVVWEGEYFPRGGRSV